MPPHHLIDHSASRDANTDPCFDAVRRRHLDFSNFIVSHAPNGGLQPAIGNTPRIALQGAEGLVVCDQKVKVLAALHASKDAVEIEPCRCPKGSTK